MPQGREASHQIAQKGDVLLEFMCFPITVFFFIKMICIIFTECNRFFSPSLPLCDLGFYGMITVSTTVELDTNQLWNNLDDSRAVSCR